MLLRLLIVVVLVVLCLALYWAYTRRQMHYISHLQNDPILGQIRPGTPAIVYFTTPGCIPCRTQQQPALTALVQTWGEESVQIIQLDATEMPDLADQWGVLAAPTTFVIDASGQTQAVNHGVADADQLARQLGLVIREAS